jgi:tetratricopeptide (TPR) repeat protein
VELVNAHPTSAPLQFLLAQWHARSGRIAEARRALESAKEADPKNLEVEVALADLDRRENHLQAAAERLLSVVSQDPRNVPALLKLAGMEESAGDQAGAVSRYRAVLEIDESNLDALNNVAYNLALDNPDEALKFGEKAAALAPDNPEVQDTLGWIYYRKGVYGKAVDCLKTAVSKGATPQRQFHLAMSYLKSGDQTAGQKLLATALQHDPNLAKTERGW